MSCGRAPQHGFRISDKKGFAETVSTLLTRLFVGINADSRYKCDVICHMLALGGDWLFFLHQRDHAQNFNGG